MDAKSNTLLLSGIRQRNHPKKHVHKGEPSKSQTPVTCKEPCTTKNMAEKVTFMEVPKGIKMAIASQDFLETKLMEEQADQVQMTLLDHSLTTVTTKVTTPNIQLWEGTSLREGLSRKILIAAS